MGAEHHRLGAVLEGVLDGGEGAHDARWVRDGARSVLRHIEIAPDEDPLVLDVHLVQSKALQRRHRGVLRILEKWGGNKCDERGLFGHLFTL